MVARILVSVVAAGCPLTLVLVGACSSSSSGSSGPPAPNCTGLTAPSSCPSPPPSWKGEVQGLFASYCLQCHGDGGIAQDQVNLATYDDVFANRERVWQQIYGCAMPNVDASPPPMAFPTLDQRQIMITWADPCNAPNN
jgi:hypothetical protein